MKIEKIKQSGLCKMQNCTHKAEYIFEIERKIIPLKFKICKYHLKKIYEKMAMEFTPKGLKNFIRKGDN